MTGGWWRRNAIALGALAALVLVGIYAVTTIEFGFVRNAERTVAAGESTDIADWGFGDVKVESLDPQTVGAPPGTDPVLVTIHVDRGHRPLTCTSPTITEPATGRMWATITTLDWQAPEDDQVTCTSRTGIPYDLVATVLLPDDVGDDLVVGLSTASQTGGLDLHFDVRR